MSFRLLHRALTQVGCWQAEGLAVDVSVNVAPAIIATAGFSSRVLEALADHDIEGEHLTIEITEHGPSVAADAMRASLTDLRAAGVGIAIDDFGSGYASFQRLFELPFSELKIDPELIGSLPRSQKARTIVAWTIDLAHTLGMRVCAAGVETSEQLAFLAGQACDLAQGFFVSEPLPASALRSFALHSKESAL
jgi:EAL domain-containing protein (putative c-di-GMP-specific phosphodiesterase class I)